MLEVTQSDFARLEADTRAAEVTAQKEYDQYIKVVQLARGFFGPKGAKL